MAAVFCMAFCLSASPAAASVRCPNDEKTPAAAPAPDAAYALLCDMNALRQRNGLQPLRWNWYLWAAAQRMANEMTKKQFFAHVTPDGRTLADRVEPTGYTRSGATNLLAENLAWGRNELASPLAVAFGWLNSPEHRENLLDPTLKEVGVGIAFGAPSTDRADGVMYVADFGDPGVLAPSRGRRARPARKHLPSSAPQFASNARARR
jgi:uncharacterized protein YkwD